MSIQDAWRFIQTARGDASLRPVVEELDAEPDLGALVQLGAERGFSFTDEELRASHRYDWGARWIRSRCEESSVSTPSRKRQKD